MMQAIDLFNSYKNIYAQSFIIQPYETNKGFGITLTENDKTAKLREVTVYNVPKNTMLLPLDDYSKLGLGNKLKNILQADLGIFQCCDYLLITIVNDEIYLFFIEMKSEKINASDIGRQFKGANCFLEYCHAIIEHFFSIPSPRLSTRNTRYILISGQRPNKQPTKRKSFAKHSKPDDFIHQRVGDDKKASIPFVSLLSEKVVK